MLNRTALDAYNVNYMVMLNYTTKEQYWQSFTALKSAMQMTENFGLLALPSDRFVSFSNNSVGHKFFRYNFLLSPATVNAWYQPERNSITFPYAAFNPPYYRYVYFRLITFFQFYTSVHDNINFTFQYRLSASIQLCRTRRNSWTRTDSWL
jgi:hypothetical protein